MALRNFIRVPSLVLPVFLVSSLMAQQFDFNNGTTQGWSLQGAYDENGAGPFSNNFVLSWTGLVNHPTPDPSDPNDGALMMYVSGGHGISGTTGQWWIMQLHSPDLSSLSGWQNASGFTVKITENMTVGSELFANLWVRVYDQDQAKDRYFYSGTAQKITYSSWFNQNAVWTSFSFNWSSIQNFPTNYQVKDVRVYIWGKLAGLYEGQLAVDEVVATAGGGTSSITLDVPNGGEIWSVGEPRIIVWHSQNLTNPVKIQYSTNGGANYSTIVASTPSDGSYDWTVPNTPSTQCRVRVADATDGSPSDVSNANFTINAGESITVDVPNGGEVWGVGEPRIIVWHSQNLSNPVKIEYSTNGGANYSTVVASTPNDGSYEWTVPNMPSAQCRVRVSDATDGNPSDVSEANFTISGGAQASLSVLSPNGGEVWTVGSQHEILWTNTNFTDPVRIEYSIDGNASHLDVVSSTTNDGSYLWTVPNTPSTLCVVIISDAADGQPGDISDAVFTISDAAQPSLTVLSPNGGEVWPTGSEQEIAWSSNFPEPVKIEYSTDGGASYAIIDTETENNGSFIWLVPDNPSSLCLIRIADATDDDPFDTSDGMFAISSGTQPSLTVISPNGGEVWPAGSEQEIAWSSNFPDPVKIEYSTDGGASYATIDTETENNGSFIWLVPDDPSSLCLIRIADATDDDPFDTSDGVFTISSEPGGGSLIVTNTHDSGQGSLRDALAAASTHPGPDTVTFDIPITDPGYDQGTGIYTLQPATGYNVPSGTTVDGTRSLPGEGSATGPGIEIDGTSLAAGATGLRLGDDVTLRGLVVNHFRYGIWVDGANITVEGCYVGTDATGTAAKPNGADGILVDSGASGAILENNLLSGNNETGIRLFGETTTGNILRNNRIGTSVDGTTPLPNSEGIRLHGGTYDNLIEMNLISGNSGIGIHLLDDGTNGNIVRHNFIGTDASGTQPLPNGSFGVAFFNGPQNNVVGPDNLVAYNDREGVLVDGSDSFTSTVGNTITANSITANGRAGIWNFRGGNTELAFPIINSIAQNVISGTATAGERIELFADESDEGAVFLGAATLDASGTFTFALAAPIPLPNLTATCTDAAGNTSEFCPPFTVTSVEELGDQALPLSFALHQNYPNPFNPETQILYELPQKAHVRIDVLNMRGERVVTLVDTELDAGLHSVVWDGRNASRQEVASGLYMCHMQSRGFTAVRKMILVR